jgi:hypothetical protein
MGPGLALCQASSSVCRRSRSASRAMFFGARSATMASKPAQKAALSTPVPGSTWVFDELVQLGGHLQAVAGVRAVMAKPRKEWKEKV